MGQRASAAWCAIVVGAGWLVGMAAAQAPTLQEQLNAQYKLVKMHADSGGMGVVDPGTLLSVQKGGILGVPWKALALCPAKFENNNLHPSAGFCANMMKNVSQYFRTGEKVYPLKIEVNADKAKISFQVVACDSCNGVNPPTAMKGEVVFQFAKGYLEKANAGEIEDLIGQVFPISNDDQQAQGGGDSDQGQSAQQPQQQPPQRQAPPTQSSQGQPQTVQMGMTTDQVQNVLGQPDKIFNLGAKQIYVYKDVKVTFLNGKVADVQ